MLTLDKNQSNQAAEPKPVADHSLLHVYGVLNIIWAGFMLLIVGFLGLVVMYGVRFSGDSGDDIFAGVMGALLIGVPVTIAMGVFAAAGVGLLKRKAWAYKVHIVGAAMMTLSCFGIIYTIIALKHAFEADFQKGLH